MKVFKLLRSFLCKFFGPKSGAKKGSSFKHSEKKSVKFCNHHFQENISNNLFQNEKVFNVLHGWQCVSGIWRNLSWLNLAKNCCLCYCTSGQNDIKIIKK